VKTHDNKHHLSTVVFVFYKTFQSNNRLLIMNQPFLYPLSAVDIGDYKTQVSDDEGYCLVYDDCGLSFKQWSFIVEALNYYADEQGKYIPSK